MIAITIPHHFPIIIPPSPASCRVVDVRGRGREAGHLDGDLRGARGARRGDDGFTQRAVRDLVEDHLREQTGLGKC